MRPHRTILIVSPNEQTTSVMAYQFHIWGYDSRTVNAYHHAIPVLREHEYDLVLLPVVPFAPSTWQPLSEVAIEAEVIQRHRHGSVRIHDVQGQLPEDYASGVKRIHGLSDASINLRYRLRLILTRKRGPKKPVPEIYLPESMRRVA